MCILMATRAHPNYDLVLLSNRDEFFARKAGAAAWRRDNYVLSPCDVALRPLSQKDFGTWIGVNRNGRIATILNLRLSDPSKARPALCMRSRGKIPTTFLSASESSFDEWNSYEKYCQQLPSLKDTGDFNFFYGDCTKGEYVIIDSLGDTFQVLRENDDEYMVVSNDKFKNEHGDGPRWQKVDLAAQTLRKLVADTNVGSEESLIQKLFEVASVNSLQREDYEIRHEKAAELAMRTVFVPPLKVSANDDLGTSVPIGTYYGTRSQTLILVSKDRSHITYVERIIHDCDLDAQQFDSHRTKTENRYDFDLQR
ncbi:hypothetical protein HG536_0D05380 [Torulaspora globosa]|uniref:Transport and Golgi organization protein 2 n=1 Tax=Torulaspora globosa TaxID=48254 RepID=A0A7G3ZHN0_9SACH|nr:uncharacterized protein HG536_0D05380 [Torulaspora globosa]QLL33016.1 hypothetical protein HG536_0D05380 [Torulaspora globosa]